MIEFACRAGIPFQIGTFPMRSLFDSLPVRVAVALAALLACCDAGRSEAQGFAAPVLVLPTSSQPVFLATADVNGDGVPDLIEITPRESGLYTAYVLLGDGKGNFTVSWSTADPTPSLGIADFLGTGHPSIAEVAAQILPTNPASTSDTTIAIFPGNGTGSFAGNGGTSAQFNYPSPGTPASTSSRFNYSSAAGLQQTGPFSFLAEDADNKVIITFRANGPVFRNSTGYALNTQTPLLGGVGPMFVGDLNGDGKPDLVVNGQTGHSASVYLGNGDGTFQPPVVLTPADGVSSMLLTDVNADGKLDLIVENSQGRIAVYTGYGDGTFAASPIGGTTSVDDSAGDGGHLIAVADVNGDGILDLLTYTPLGISIELGTASGNYTLQGVYPVGIGAGANGQFVTADFNGDGALDIALDAPGGVEILYGKAAAGSGSCATPAAATVAACPEPSGFEQPFTLTAIGPGGVGGGDTGTVTFSIAGSQSYQTQSATLGTAPMVNGVATLMVSGEPLMVGTPPAPAPIIPGTYAVAGGFVATGHALAENLPGTHAISLSPTTVTLTPAPPSTTLGPTYYYGQGVNGYVHFNVVYPAYPATGTWTQLSNGVPVPGCVDLPANGNSSCPYGYPTLLDAGNYVFTEAYNGGPANGDPINASSVSDGYAFDVMPDITSASALSSSMNPAPVGTAVTFTVTLTGNAAVPTGTVQFLDGTGVIGNGTLNSAGQASFTTSALAVGTHPITAMYAATLDFNGVTSAVLNQKITAVVLQPLASAVTLASSVNPSVVGQPVTFTATTSVPGPFPFLIQSGTMTFLDGSAAIGTGTINPFGRATFTTSTLALGSHPITASYPGGTDAGGQVIAASVSAVLTQVVGTGLRAAPPGFTLTVTPNPVVLKPGSTGIELVTVAAVSGFSEPVTLTCAGTNSGNELGCDFLEGTIPAGGGATTLDLTTTAPYPCGGSPTKPYLKHGEESLVTPSCAVPPQRVRSSRWLAGAMGGPMIAGLIWIWPSRRRHRAKLVALTMLAGMLGLSGCGHCSNLGTRPGNYTVTVIGTAGSTTQSVVLKVEVLDP